MVFADVLSTVNAVSAVIAAIAALVTIYFARQTVAEARQARAESATAHAEEIARMRHAADATIAEEKSAMEAAAAQHKDEMVERQRALATELTLRRLEQFERVSELLRMIAHAAQDALMTDPALSGGKPRSRLPALLYHLRAAVRIFHLIDGSLELPKAGALARRGYVATWTANDYLTAALDALDEVNTLLQDDDTMDAVHRSLGAF
jgi:uncharacterized membrane protein